MPTGSDRFRGCLLGLACGDAVGVTAEFQPRGSFPPVADMVGGGVFRLQPGQWTDDTSMALCLASSLVETGRFDPRDQMERYWRWYRDGYLSSTGYCFDIGNTTRAALSRFDQSGEPYSGSTHPGAAGNGFVFREDNAEALWQTMQRACRAWREPALWRRLQRNGMRRDCSWTPAAAAYVALYRRAVAAPRVTG